MAGLTATISVPGRTTERAQAPIFSVMLQVVLGLMILMRICSSLAGVLKKVEDEAQAGADEPGVVRGAAQGRHQHAEHRHRGRRNQRPDRAVVVAVAVPVLAG